MNWIQENKKLAGILGVLVAGVLGLGVWLYFSYAGYSAAKEEYTQVTSQIATLMAAKLTPSAENLRQKEERVNAYAEEVEKLREVLLLNQQAITPMAENDFQAKLKQRVTAIKQVADRAGVQLPAEFALGFDEYATSLPKSPEISAELNLHLEVMEKLVATLIDSGVKKLDFLERTKLVSEKSAAPAPIQPVKPKPQAAKGKKPTAAALASAEPVLDRYPIKLVMTSDQAPFQNVMNVLANPNPKVMPYFMVVRQVRVENEKAEAPLKEEIKGLLQSGGQAPDAAAPPVKAVTSGPLPAKHDAVTIMGNEMLKIFLEVDYIRFRGAKEPAAPAAPAQAKQ